MFEERRLSWPGGTRSDATAGGPDASDLPSIVRAQQAVINSQAQEIADLRATPANLAIMGAETPTVPRRAAARRSRRDLLRLGGLGAVAAAGGMVVGAQPTLAASQTITEGDVVDLVPDLANKLSIIGSSNRAFLGSATKTRSVWADRANFNEIFQFNQVMKSGNPYTDPVWGWGYNLSTSFTREVATEPMCSDRLEGGWWDGTRTQLERHVAAYMDPANSDEIRPYSIYITVGADGGLGSPSHSFTIGNGGAGGFTIQDNALRRYLGISNGLATFGVQVQFNGTAGVAGSQYLTIGDGTTTGSDAALTFSPAPTQNATLKWNQNNVGVWQIYQLHGDASLYFRDIVNGKMLLTMYPGTGSTGQANFSGTITAKGGALAVTGAKSGNTALASLITQMVAIGLITDSTTA
jgi:hypothetical protein